MALSYDEAYDAITTYFTAEWAAKADDIVGYVPDIRFAGIEEKEKPTVTFVRFVMNPVSSPQSTLRNAEYGQRYENNGIIIVQLLVERKSVQAEAQARKLAQVAQGIFRDPGFPGCFIFRNIRINNLEPEATWLRKNVITEYQFDELV